MINKDILHKKGLKWSKSGTLIKTLFFNTLMNFYLYLVNYHNKNESKKSTSSKDNKESVKKG